MADSDFLSTGEMCVKASLTLWGGLKVQQSMGKNPTKLVTFEQIFVRLNTVTLIKVTFLHGVFHVFKIVQTVSNQAKLNIFSM